jgi:hypothetical protein
MPVDSEEELKESQRTESAELTEAKSFAAVLAALNAVHPNAIFKIPSDR